MTTIEGLSTVELDALITHLAEARDVVRELRHDEAAAYLAEILAPLVMEKARRDDPTEIAREQEEIERMILGEPRQEPGKGGWRKPPGQSGSEL